MSGTSTGRQLPQPDSGLTPVEQHLGDRLAALIDGELGHDARERVLSHLATCWSCRTEADAQRRLKTVFADTAPPPPSDGLLARLQGLPAGGPDGPSGPPAPTGPDRSRGGDRGLGRGPDGGFLPTLSAGPSLGGGSAWVFDYLPGGRGSSALSVSRGFRIHDMDRLSSRGRRFAFAAAGAVSLAALALGGALGASPAASGPAVAKGDGGGASASSVRTAVTAANTDRDRRRRGGRNERSAVDANSAFSGASVASTASDRSAVFQHGAPWAMPSAPPAAAQQPGTFYPLMRSALAVPPLIRSALPPASYSAYRTDMDEGMPVNKASAHASVRSAPAPSPLTTAAPPPG